MNKTIVAILILLIAVLAVAYIMLRPRPLAVNLDDFAQCLADKGAIMYGAEWCPYCQNEKKAFGPSFKNINYVECPDDPQKCIAAGIDSYPTWILKDGKKLEGKQGLEKLAQESGCKIPKGDIN